MDTRTLLLGACAALFVLGIPLVFRLVPPNRIYGFRTAATLSRPDIWYRVNVFAGWALMSAAATAAIIIALVPQLSEPAAAIIFVLLVLGATAASFAYLKRSL